MTKEEELSRYMAQIEYYKEQMNSLDQQFQFIQAAIADYSKAKITLEELEKTGSNSEILLPIGGSTYIDAKVNNTSTVLFDIGAGLVTEKKVNESIKKIDVRINDLQKNLEKLQTMMQQMQSDATEISVKAQKLYSEIQQG